jgi:hypothetical protein
MVGNASVQVRSIPVPHCRDSYAAVLDIKRINTSNSNISGSHLNYSNNPNHNPNHKNGMSFDSKNSFNFYNSRQNHNSYENMRIVFSGDCRPSQALITAGSNCDLLLHEATFDDSMESDAECKRHCTTSEAVTVGKRMKAKHIVLTHFSQRYPVAVQSYSDSNPPPLTPPPPPSLPPRIPLSLSQQLAVPLPLTMHLSVPPPLPPPLAFPERLKKNDNNDSSNSNSNNNGNTYSNDKINSNNYNNSNNTNNSNNKYNNKGSKNNSSNYNSITLADIANPNKEISGIPFSVAFDLLHFSFPSQIHLLPLATDALVRTLVGVTEALERDKEL